METRQIHLSLLIVVLALTAQLSFISPSIQAQNTKAHMTMKSRMLRTNSVPGIQGYQCNRRCNNIYESCLQSGKNPKACRVQLRNCLSRCPPR
jgi:hypothetical protein